MPLMMERRSEAPLPSGVIPAERNFAWNPGLTSKGGIPERTVVCATLSPGANIQAALDKCPAGQVVKLNAGMFIVDNYLRIHSGITLRGAGAGSTILAKTNGTKPRNSTAVAGTRGILTPANNAYIVPDAQPIIVVGATRWSVPAVRGLMLRRTWPVMAWLDLTR